LKALVQGVNLKGIPSTPTDNIYKFMAISGLWFIAGFIAIYLWLVTTQIQLDKEALKSQQYYFSVNMERKIEKRLASIENKNFGENSLDWVSVSYTPKQEKEFISKALKNHQETIQNNKSVNESTIGDKLKLLERWDVRVGAILYIILMVILTWFGFSRWVKKTHLVDEEIKSLDQKIKDKNLKKLETEEETKNLDREIKEKTLEKLEVEIQQIKLTSQPIEKLDSEEEIKKIDQEIKEKTLEKLEVEIQQLKLTSQSISRLRRWSR
jgi:hypothetical protein